MPDSAIYYYEQALRINIQNGQEFRLTGLYINIGNIFLLKDDFEKALAYYNRALNLELIEESAKTIYGCYDKPWYCTS
ncbi:MAG: tetratricopeptide repeat protein [Bacteroidales bacterium]|nr:tetratricopeptide repeat protein [Bacteroidales bacterium]